MNKPVATLILNRNLPQISDQLGDHLLKWNGDITDVFVIESGSDANKLSKHKTFWANWPEAIENGLRYPRGFNYGLMEVEKYAKYQFYFMVLNDAMFSPEPTIEILLNEMEQWSKFGIISPASPIWGEAQSIPPSSTKCHWLIPHLAWMFRSTFLDTIKEKNNATYLNYFYDGENFRGYDADTEIGIKAYLNNYSLAITNKTQIVEDHSITEKMADFMKTDKQDVHRSLMYKEGLAWMKKKYGFDSKWEMRTWAKRVYEDFFNRNTDYARLKI